jgi:predicted nucleic acid-binding protein
VSLTPFDHLVDTGLLIRTLRGDARANILLNHLALGGRVLVSAVTVVEVLRGSRNAGQEEAARTILGKADVVDLDYGTAETAAKLLRDWGGILSSERALADAIIAATAMAVPATLVTLNTRQFSRLPVPGLDLMLIDQQAADWTAGL